MRRETSKWSKIPVGKTPGTTLICKEFWESLDNEDLIIEVGTGSGRAAAECLERGFRVLGCDINELEVEHTKRQLGKRFASSKFDVRYHDITKSSLSTLGEGALLLGLLGALVKKDRLMALKNTISSLKPGSILYISEFLINTDDPILLQRYEAGLRLGDEYGTFPVYDDDQNILYFTHNFYEQELLELMKKSGLKIIFCKRQEFMSYHGNKRKGISIMGKV